MATPSPDPNPHSWPQLTARARAEKPPTIDVRAAVRVAIASEPAPLAPPAWTDELFELLSLPWARVVFAGGCAVALALCLTGWHSLTREMSDPIMLALRSESADPFASDIP